MLLAVTPLTVAPEAVMSPALTVAIDPVVTSFCLRICRFDAVMPFTFAPEAARPFAVNWPDEAVNTPLLISARASRRINPVIVVP